MKRLIFPLTLAAAALSLPVGAEEPRKVITPGQGNTVVAAPPKAEPTPEATSIAPTVIPASPVPTASEAAARDREFLEQHPEAPRREPALQRAEEEEGPGEPLLAGGPYETATPHVQAEVFRRAESILRRHGLLEPGGVSEADLEEAIFRYQSAERIPLTGRLDTTTLITMRLMPREETQEVDAVERGRPVEVFRGRIPRTSREAPPGVVRGIPLE